MRTRHIVLIGALLPAFAGVAQAQQSTSTPPLNPKIGMVDFGARLTDVSGDAGRFQRFRDLRDGITLDLFKFETEQEDWVFAASAANVGYRDQRYTGAFEKLGRVKASFEWDQVPLFISQDTRTLFTNAGDGVLTLDDSIQQGIQNRTLTLAQAVQGVRGFEMRNRRDSAVFDLVYTATRNLDLKLGFKTAKRDGTTLMNGALSTPGGGIVYELPVPLDNRTTDVAAKVEWANGRGLFAIAYDGSWFDNRIQTLTWDNVNRITDAASNPARGQLALAPTNMAHTFSTQGSIKLPARSRASAAISFGTWTQNEALLAPTVNTALVAPVLERPTAEAEARIVTMNYTFTSRPNKYTWFNARYRYYDYDNRTPIFDISSMVVADLSLGAASESEPQSYRKQNFDADLVFSPLQYASFKVGYGRDTTDRTFRIFEQTNEDVFRVSADSVGNRYFTIRTIYEFSTRKGDGFDEHLLDEVGEQPAMRHFDLADRDRNRVTAIVTVTPIDALGVNASIAAGRDEYTDTGFGLRDNDHRIYNVGFDVVPGDKVDFGVNYGYEKYTAFQYSRTANPLSPTNRQFLDPTRDWSTDSTDEVRTVMASLNLVKVVPRTDMRFSYDLSKSEATYVYGLAANTTLAAPVPLPPVRNELETGRADVSYFLRKDVAIGVVYWYEHYTVDDFALSESTINRLDLPNTVYLGYVYRPYTANAVWLKLTYLW